MSTTYPSDLTDADWECVRRYLPPVSGRGRPRTHPLRRILDAIFYLVRSGCAWRYLPSNFPPWETVGSHFRRFRLQGAWHLLYTALHRAERARVGRHPDPSAAIMDSQSVKTVEESASIRGYDAHKRVKGRKRHLLVDTLGLPIASYGTPADMHDSIGARYGYELLWMLVLVTLGLCVVQEVCARLGAATGQGLAGLIRARRSVRGAVFAMLTQLVADALIIISEFAGVADTSELLGLPPVLSVPLAAAIWLVVVERIFLLMTLHFFAYPVAAALGHPDWGTAARQAVVPTVHLASTLPAALRGHRGHALHAVLHPVERCRGGAGDAPLRPGSRRRLPWGDLRRPHRGLYAHRHGGDRLRRESRAGVPIDDAGQAATALVPFLGRYAGPLFALGLLGASLLVAAVLPLSTTYALCESFGFERGVGRSFREAPIFYGVFTGLLALGALVALLPSLSLVGVILLAQVINGILLPILRVFILRLVNDRRLMSERTNSWARNAVAWATMTLLSALSLVLLSALSLVLLASVFLPFLGPRFLS